MEEFLDELITQTRALLTGTPQHWSCLVQSLSTDLLTRPTAPGEWSAVECLRLMVETEERMIHAWPAHDLNSTVQVEHALMQPFLQGCGPWVQPCADHVVSG